MTDPTAQPDEEHEGSFQDVFNNSQASESDTTLQEADTSAAHAKFSEEPSLFEKLQQDAREQFGIEADMSTTPLTPQANGKRQRMRDLSFDSPDNSFAETVDTVPEPELQTMNFGLGKLGHAKLKDAPEPTPKISKGKQRAFEEPSTVKPSARTSTPAKPKSRDLSPSRLSAQMPEGWSAKKPTDLSKTPLTSQSSRSYYAPSNISDISSPPTMSYKFSHLPTQIARTPGKTAAQWMTQDVLETAALQMGDHRTESMLESPVIEPPSVIKNWDKRNYGGMADSPLQRPKQPDFGRVIDDDDEADDHTQVNDDVSFGSIGDAPIEDWDAGERSGMTVGGEDEDENESGNLSEQLDSKLGMEEEEDSFDIRQEAPDTLFGGNRDAGQLDKLGAFLKGGGAVDMHTLHGGRQLPGQCHLTLLIASFQSYWRVSLSNQALSKDEMCGMACKYSQSPFSRLNWSLNCVLLLDKHVHVGERCQLISCLLSRVRFHDLHI